MARRPFDAYFKSLLEYRTKDFVRLPFSNVKLQVISAKLDKELIVFKTRLADQVLHVRTKRESLLHFEYVSGYDPEAAHTVFLNAALLENKYQLKVASVLFLLRPSRRGAEAGCYEVYLGGEPTNIFKCRVVNLSEWREAILSGRRSLLVFVPLLTAISPRVDKALLARQRALLARVKNKKLRETLLFFTIAFAKRYFSEKFLLNFFKEKIEMIDPIEQVPFFGEKFREKRLEGEREGEKRGTTITLQKSILEVVASRFAPNGYRNVVNGKLARMVTSIDEPRKLEAIFHHALTAKSLETVVVMLAKAQASAKPRAAKAQPVSS